ncbi:MAG: hypothetical protein ACRED5_01115, partial [Propylenella sp.]
MRRFGCDLGLLFSVSALAVFLVVGIYKFLPQGAVSLDVAAIAALLAIAAFSVPLAAFYFRTKDKE